MGYISLCFLTRLLSYILFSGIVGAETVLSIARDKPISPSTSTDGSTSPPFMFPSIIGLLAFDTPYLGISPGVLAHNAETHYQTVKGAWSAYNSVTNAFGLGSKAPVAPTAIDASKALPAPPAPADAAAVPSWQKWGRYAMYAGAAGAVLAGGAAAYANRGTLSEGLSWATGHLEFVGCLARGAQLEGRVADVVALNRNRSIGFRNLFTQLGSGAGTLTWRDGEESGGWAHEVVSTERTFCLLPKGETKSYFEPTINDKAGNEITAHMNMFTPKDNPGYYGMSERAKEVIVEWVTNGWHVPEAEPKAETTTDGAAGRSALDEDPEIVYKEEVEKESVHEGNPWAS
jgi:hypothetical protein